MAKFNKDSMSGTLLVVLLLSLVCSIIVAGSAVILKPAQDEQKQLDKQKNILSVAGLLQPKANIKEIFAKNIESRLVDLSSGDYVPIQAGFDAKAAAKDPTQSISIAPELDKAGIRTRAKLAEVYLVKDEQNSVTQIVLPIYGRGLWSTMYGFVSIAPDGNTINGITFYDHGETPGLGGEIENPKWQSQFHGKTLYNEQSQPAIQVRKGGSIDKVHGVDALSGATLTSNGVQHTFDYWFSANGFLPYLTKLRAGAN